MSLLAVDGEYMSNIPRNHHYLPQSYLKRFSKNGSKNSNLLVLDILQKKTFSTTPRNVACERDFNTIRSPNSRPDVLEKNIANFEVEINKSIGRVESTSQLIDEDRQNILKAIAMFSIRNPHNRRHMGNLMDKMIKQESGFIFGEEKFDASSNVEFKEFHENDEYKVEFPREKHIQIELKQCDAILPCFVKRDWKLIRSPDEYFFVTSDSPVVLKYIDEEKAPPLFHQSPGFCLPGTFVAFPLTKSLALLGVWGGEEKYVFANKQQVAFLNYLFIFSAVNQIYTLNDHFCFLDNNGKLFEGSDSFFKLLEC